MRILENNIYFDPLTAMPNFFKFIQSDTNSMFGEKGSVMVFYMAKFIDINKNYGRDTGDLFLKIFAFNLRSILKDYKDILMFRTQGDEFTIIMHNMQFEETEALAKQIESEYKRRIKEMGFSNVDVHTVVLSYSQRINSINEFYNMMFTQCFKMMKSVDSNFSEERLIEGIVSNFTNRIHETLSLLKDAYSLAMTDDVSTLPNQRAARIYLKDLMKENKEEDKEFSVLFIDGDNLKRYNQISYETGNEMIKALSQLIESSIRKNDKIFRWLSGDEFLVILDKVNLQDGIKLAERIRASVEEQTSKWLYPITVSIGMACYPEQGTTIKELISKAEKANIMAKNLGKNKVVKWAADEAVK